jgi:hypothetical protein
LQDEVDPLDAFMAGNVAGAVAAATAPPPQQQQQQRSKPPISSSAAAADGGTDVQMTDADGDTAAAAAAGGEDDDVDPLDAFMAENAAVAAAEPAAADDDLDPLDAFMAAQVMPEVAKVRWSETVAEPTAEPAAAAAAGGSAAAAAGESSRPGSRPGTPSSSKRAASSKPKSSRVRRYYGSSSSEEFSDSEVRIMVYGLWFSLCCRAVWQDKLACARDGAASMSFCACRHVIAGVVVLAELPASIWPVCAAPSKLFISLQPGCATTQVNSQQKNHTLYMQHNVRAPLHCIASTHILLYSIAPELLAGRKLSRGG